MKRSLLTVLSILIALTASPSTYAIDRDFYSSNDILFSDPDATSCVSSTSGGAVGLVGDDNYEKGLRYFVGQGLSLNQSAGIIGNFAQESRMDPSIIEGGDSAPADYTPVNGTGFGIAQWTFTSRQSGLVKLSNSSDRDIIDLSLQLDYVWQELNGSYSSTLDALREIDDPLEAAVLFHQKYEGSADTAEEIEQNRGGKAIELAAEYQGKIAGGGSNTGSCNGNGTPSAFVDGFAIYNQNDPQWANNSYGTASTIGKAGCGPSAMAMIITALTNQQVTPADTAKYGAEHGTTADNGAGGSLWNVADVLSKNWGLTSQQIYSHSNLTGVVETDISVAQINEYLRDGGLVLASGTGSIPYTANGHFIVIRAVTENNTWLVGDSNGQIGIENSDKEWQPEEIMSMTRGMWLVEK